MYAYVQEKMQDEATLQLSKPSVSRYQRAVQNIGVRIDAPEWKKDSTLVSEFNTLGSGMADFAWGAGKEHCPENRTFRWLEHVICHRPWQNLRRERERA